MREAAEHGQLPKLDKTHIRLLNTASAGIGMYVFNPGQLAYSPTVPLVYLAPNTHLDLEATRGQPVKFAIRRREDARMFFLQAGSVLAIERVSHVAKGQRSSKRLGDKKLHRRYTLHDMVCTLRGDFSSPAPWDTSFEILPGPLFWNLPRNMQDAELEVGTTLTAEHGPVCFKVVRDQGTDWRGYPTARIRVVNGGLYGSKVFHHGSMYLAKLVPSERAASETIAAHRRIGGMFGHPAQISRFEGQFEAQTGARLLIFEDFGERMTKFLQRGERVTPKDADCCVADLLRAVGSMHSSGLHHLAICPQNVWLRRDGTGRLRLKVGNLGVSEQPSEPLPPGRAVPLAFVAPEIGTPHRLQAMAQIASGARDKQPSSSSPGYKISRLGSLGELPTLPSLQRAGAAAAAATAATPLEKPSDRQDRIRELLLELEPFEALDPASLQELCHRFRGPFLVPPGRTIFRQGDVGDFLYLVVSGEVVSLRGGKELCRYRRGDFFGEAALLGKRPSKRIFSTLVRRGAASCAVLRLSHKAFQADLGVQGPLAELVAPSRWKFLSDAKMAMAEPKAADMFSVGALWCQLVTGDLRPAPLARVRRADTIDKLRTAVAARDLGNFYFTVEERRIVALITLLIRRAAPSECLRILEAQDLGASEGSSAAAAAASTLPGEAAGGAKGPDEDLGHGHGQEEEQHQQRGSILGGLERAWGDLASTARSVTELSPAGQIASDAVQLSARAGRGFAEEFGRLENLATNRFGNVCGEFLGDLYGGLFAKDLMWMVRDPSRIQKFPVNLVREAEEGSMFARWYIGARVAFEGELCKQTWPRIGPSIRPAFTAGFEIGAAVGRNRAINFKILWIDAFLGSFVKRLRAQLRLMLQRVRGSAVRWDDLSALLQDAVTKGQSARRIVLLTFGRLPTTYDQNEPQVLNLLPYHWVPDIGLPLANGIGRGFFRRLQPGFRRGRRVVYVRPKFETWDVEEVPQVIMDFAREQGAQQAALVASSVGDTVARDLGWTLGGLAGAAWGLLLAASGRRPVGINEPVAGGSLKDEADLLMLTRGSSDDAD